MTVDEVAVFLQGGSAAGWSGRARGYSAGCWAVSLGGGEARPGKLLLAVGGAICWVTVRAGWLVRPGNVCSLNPPSHPSIQKREECCLNGMQICT